MNKNIINFDNSATTFPKPLEVRHAVSLAVREYGNAGRGGHILSQKTSSAVFSARENIADFFDAQPENVVFALNCTHALNMAIQGIMAGGGHMIISELEHNSSARPAFELLRQNKIRLSVARVFPDDRKTLESFRELILPDTKAIVCTGASNVTGQILPFKLLAGLCREKNICLIVDGAQITGIVDVRISDGINILCTAGHKGLYGISGTGLLISDGKFPVYPILQGGTGSASASLRQPLFLPDSLENGTLNVAGIMSVSAGIDFIRKTGMNKIFQHESHLCDLFIDSLRNFPQIIIYRSPDAHYVPIVSFNVKNINSEDVSGILSEKGFCLRAGFHCSALAHNALGTLNGTVRFSPSVFNSEREVLALANLIKNLEIHKK